MAHEVAEPIVATYGLSKIYGTVRSLDACDLQVPAGSVFGLVGPNGAGKTTLIRTLLGYLRPTSGEARVCGYDCRSQSLLVRQHTSYLPGEARLYRAMRGSQLLELFAGLRNHGSLVRSQQIARQLDLDLKRRVMFMSTGMRQKLALAIVLGSHAPLTILDEPTANLDPTMRAEILHLIRQIRDAGRTVILSSHIFSDIEQACDRIAMLKQGRLVLQRPLRDLPEVHTVRGHVPADHDVSAWGQLPFVRHVHSRSESEGRAVEIQLSGSPTAWLSWLAAQPLREPTIERAGLQDVYQSLHAASPPVASAP